MAESADSAPLFRLGNVLVYDAIGKPDEGNMTVQPLAPGQRYLLTLSANDAFLSDPDTVYPVVIDPTIKIPENELDASSIHDVSVFSGRPDTNHGTYTYNRVGTPSTAYGVGRTAIRLRGLIQNTEYRALSESQIVNVSFYAKETSGGPSQFINLYPLNNTTWTESGATWNNIGSYSTALNCGATLGGSQWTAFDITNLVKAWKTGTYSADAGFIMMNQNESANNKSFAATEYSTTSYRPYITITYTENLFYSKYDPTKYNDTGTRPQHGEYTEAIQYRMNCYGYAFGFILNSGATYTGSDRSAYKQQPGEFATTENKANTVDFLGATTHENVMSGLIANMHLDASRWGYTITEYFPTSSTIPQFGVSSRLIAAVTGFSGGYADFHFYTQHNDGTWSHKQGGEAVTNLSIVSHIELNNNNIQMLANEDIYADGLLKFFIITKPAIIDYTHSACCCDMMYWPCDHNQCIIYSKEMAGEYIETARNKKSGSTTCRIDFAKDYDVFRYIPFTSGSYSISVTTSSSANADLDCMVYNDDKSLLYSDTLTGQFSFTIQLEADQSYYFDIYNYRNTIVDYMFTVIKEEQS